MSQRAEHQHAYDAHIGYVATQQANMLEADVLRLRMELASSATECSSLIEMAAAHASAHDVSDRALKESDAHLRAMQDQQQYSNDELSELLRQRQDLTNAYGQQATDLAAMHDQLSQASDQLTHLETLVLQEFQRIGQDADHERRSLCGEI